MSKGIVNREGDEGIKERGMRRNEERRKEGRARGNGTKNGM